MACAGNPVESCGGSNRLSLFRNEPPAPITNPGAGLWSSIGCYTDSAPRTLGVQMAVAGGAAAMSVQLCTSACENGDYRYAGLEYSGECCKSPIISIPLWFAYLEMADSRSLWKLIHEWWRSSS